MRYRALRKVTRTPGSSYRVSIPTDVIEGQFDRFPDGYWVMIEVDKRGEIRLKQPSPFAFIDTGVGEDSDRDGEDRVDNKPDHS